MVIKGAARKLPNLANACLIELHGGGKLREFLGKDLGEKRPFIPTIFVQPFLVDAGAEEVGQVFNCAIVLSTLFDDAAVRKVLLASGVLASAPAGTIHVCMSTISSALAEDLIQEHRRHGLGYVGAPMFGRPDIAAAAKLNIVTAAAPDLLQQVEPVLSVLGKTWRVGDDPRIAHIAKIAGNFMIGYAIETMAESAALISLNGGDPGLFLTMLGETLFNSFIYRSYGGAVAGGKSPGAPSGLRLPLKDVGLTLGEAQALGTRTPFATLLGEQLQLAERENLGHEDWSVRWQVLHVFRRDSAPRKMESHPTCRHSKVTRALDPKPALDLYARDLRGRIRTPDQSLTSDLR